MSDAPDMIPASKAYELYGIPRAALRDLAEQGRVRFVERQIDVCHKIVFYSKSDLENFINGNS